MSAGLLTFALGILAAMTIIEVDQGWRGESCGPPTADFSDFPSAAFLVVALVETGRVWQ